MPLSCSDQGTAGGWVFTEDQKALLTDITNDMKEPTTVAHLLDVIDRLCEESGLDPQILSPRLRADLAVCMAAL